MNNIGEISLDEYYLWRKKTETNYPWKRQYLNCEFLNYEQKRIEKTSQWYKDFKKVCINEKMDSVSFYVVPLKLYATWKTAIANHGNYEYIGLSALFNSPQILLIGLIPYSVEKPKDYRLIEITESKKIHLVNERMEKIESALVIKEWESLQSDRIYVDVDYEKRIISKIFKEILGADAPISLSLQSPIVSAPYDGSIGGISLSSLAENSSFAKELLKITQIMVPPEYRELSPPKKVYFGKNFQGISGSKFHLSERPNLDRNILSSLYTMKYNNIEKKNLERRKFRGEFSLLSSLKPYRGRLEALKKMFKEYTTTEVTLPRSLDKRLDGTFLPTLKNSINENLWIQIVYSRQNKPVLDTNNEKEFSRLKDDLNILLPDIHGDPESKEYWVNSLLYPLRNNMNRVALSLARAEEKRKLKKRHLKRARELLVDNMTIFVEMPQIQDSMYSLKKKRSKAGPRYLLVQTMLINHPGSTTKEIFEDIKFTEAFDDRNDLQELLDWMKKKDLVIRDGYGKYTWVGSSPKKY